MSSIERILDCSGWCDNVLTHPLIYKFSDVNRGKPQKICYDTMKENTISYAHIVGWACIGVAGFMALICICNLCICFSPEKRSMKMRDRLVVRDGNYYRPA